MKSLINHLSNLKSQKNFFEKEKKGQIKNKGNLVHHRRDLDSLGENINIEIKSKIISYQ